MLKLPTGARRRAILLSATALLAGGAASGCDLQEDADLERGRNLFIENCQACHTLAEAGTSATVGPNLDASFAAARETGMDQDTIEGVVQAQIENPRTIREGNPNYDKIYMPADLVTGRDAEAVAAYVASVAGIPGIEPPPLPDDPQQLFAEKCGGCHELAAANTAGGVGPSLDEVLPGQSAKQIEESIRDPQAEFSPGFENAQMPEFNDSQLPAEYLKELIEYLLQEAGGGS